MSTLTLTEFDQLINRGCGLDVHKDIVVGTIMGEGVIQRTVTFSTLTDDILILSNWLKSEGITHVAMESTGIYWKPIYHLLDPDFTVILVNARHIKNVPGRKTDKNDSAWIAKLLLSGLLKGSFIPPRFIRELRELHRYKRKLIQQQVSERNRCQKILHDANIKISSVLTDIYGKTGSLIINAIIMGETDAKVLANFAQGQVRKRIEVLYRSLKGNITSQHRYMLASSMQLLSRLDQSIEALNLRIDQYLKQIEGKVALLQTIPGVGRETIIAILGEIGTDMSAFKSHRHLASWCGLSPGNNESAGKIKSSRTTQGNKWLKSALVEAAWQFCRNKSAESTFKRKFLSIVVRRGKKKALLAVAHKILIAVYYILKFETPYREPDNEAYLEKKKQAQINKHLKRLHELGINIPSQL